MSNMPIHERRTGEVATAGEHLSKNALPEASNVPMGRDFHKEASNGLVVVHSTNPGLEPSVHEGVDSARKWARSMGGYGGATAGAHTFDIRTHKATGGNRPGQVLESGIH